MTNEIEYTSVKHKTIGQIPIQVDAKQVQYEYEGELGQNKYLSLVTANTNPLTDAYTGQSVFNPCTTLASVNLATTGTPPLLPVPDSTHSGPLQGGLTDKIITSLDSTNLDTSIKFAVCYSSNYDGSTDPITSGTWRDSGIRITVAKVTSVAYKYATGASVINERIRTMTTIHTATNVLPQGTNIGLHYAGSLAND
jgi:hypothetical protein